MNTSSATHSTSKPSLLLLILMAGLPQIGETIYSPALPSISQTLFVSHGLVETTLTIYLIGFAFGILFWGPLSDKWGRKPIMMLGFLFYCLGSLGCAFSSSFWMLFIFRFIQAFGGAVGSVLSQTIARDAFDGRARSHVFATVAIALSFSPVLGPILGGILTDFINWRMIFLGLFLTGFMLEFYIFQSLKETKPQETNRASLLKIIPKMIKDRLLISFGFMVGGLHGIIFIFIAEGPFYLIDFLHIRPSLYGILLFIPALSLVGGSYLTRKLIPIFPEKKILLSGIFICFLSSVFLLSFSFCGFITEENKIGAIMCILVPLSGILLGNGLSVPICLSHALKHYSYAAGTAGALYGCFYYSIIAGLTYIMSVTHNDTIYPMPCLFMAIFIVLLILMRTVIYPVFTQEGTVK
ncbi:MAG: multidrug effflux MFS transporter [Proteobacteria bacterium]|nr:multidrug effflux MFS transporter [Pseudomonadota bacterium]